MNDDFTGTFLTFLVLLIMFLLWRTKRISRPEDLPDDYIGMKLSGIVTSVSDGDGFRFFHTPWLRSSEYTRQDDKLSIRLAGIDAPEMPAGAKPGQPFAQEAKDYLSKLVWKKQVDLKIVGKDQYNRILAYAEAPSGWLGLLGTIRINFEMVKKGYACVYTGRDAKYDGQLKELQELEEHAKKKKIGMWKFKNTVTPMEHKRIHRAAIATTATTHQPSSLLDVIWKKIAFWK